MHFGADDAIIPLEDVIDVRMAFAGRGNVEVALYPGAAHGFTHPDGPAFKASAAEGAMASLRYLLEDEEDLVGGAA
jgi:dienelactone hydrolase